MYRMILPPHSCMPYIVAPGIKYLIPMNKSNQLHGCCYLTLPYDVGLSCMISVKINKGVTSSYK